MYCIGSNIQNEGIRTSDLGMLPHASGEMLPCKHSPYNFYELNVIITILPDLVSFCLFWLVLVWLSLCEIMRKIGPSIKTFFFFL